MDDFNGCSNLHTVIISDYVKTIGQYAFRGCKSLTSLTLGKNVETIARGAFLDCSALTTVTLTADIMAVEAYAFEGCKSLSTVNYDGTVTQWSIVTKGSDWLKNTAVTAIKCTDGEVATK